MRLADIAPFFCPSQIQAYVINGAEVVFLRPRPSSKVPDKQDEKIEPCRACGRHCRAPTTFCSLTCKVSLDQWWPNPGQCRAMTMLRHCSAVSMLSAERWWTDYRLESSVHGFGPPVLKAWHGCVRRCTFCCSTRAR